jgi:hypothetical protein
VRSYLLPLLALATACSSEGSSKKQEKTTEPERKLAGVYPEKFQCDSIIKPEELATLLGAVKASLMDSAMTPPRGLAAPCAYQVTMQSEMAYWTYDFDCRDGYKQRADALFEQYKRTSGELVQAFDAAADAGIKPTDAGIEIKRPEDSAEVSVGAKALDHHGQGLLFIDDDAPCYVRVVGPNAANRLALAQHIAKALTFMNAPMTPRAAP